VAGPPQKIKLSTNDRTALRKEIYKDKLGDKATSFSVWTLTLPVSLVILGGLFGVEAVKVQNVYALNIGILLSGFGEALTQGNRHHRGMHLSLGANIGALLYLVLAWVQSASGSEGTQFFDMWSSAVVATALTTVATGVNIMIGVSRDAEAEVDRWTEI